MIVRFWGVRGSIPVPGPETVRTGGNTSCLQIVHGDEVIICDSGTGIRPLGQELMRSDRISRINILLSHTHWDHIQGLPFFAPLYREGQEIQIFGPAGLEKGLEDAVLAQLQRLYFPIRRSEVGARLLFREIGEEKFRINGLEVSTKWMNHPVLSLGFAFADGEASLVYTGDNEPYTFYHVYAPNSSSTVKISISVKEREKRQAALLDFFRGRSMVVADCQYTDDEYAEKIGWGHSHVSYVITQAIDAGVRTLVLFHHDPHHSDDVLEGMVEAARRQVSERGASLKIVLAREGEELEA